MKTTVLRYNVIIQKEHHDYIAYVPTLGISDFGKSVTTAKRNVEKAITCHIQGLAKTNSEIPHPDMQEFYISQSEITAPKNIHFAF